MTGGSPSGSCLCRVARSGSPLVATGRACPRRALPLLGASVPDLPRVGPAMAVSDLEALPLCPVPCSATRLLLPRQLVEPHDASTTRDCTRPCFPPLPATGRRPADGAHGMLPPGSSSWRERRSLGPGTLPAWVRRRRLHLHGILSSPIPSFSSLSFSFLCTLSLINREGRIRTDPSCRCLCCHGRALTQRPRKVGEIPPPCVVASLHPHGSPGGARLPALRRRDGRRMRHGLDKKWVGARSRAGNTPLFIGICTTKSRP